MTLEFIGRDFGVLWENPIEERPRRGHMLYQPRCKILTEIGQIVKVARGDSLGYLQLTC